MNRCKHALLTVLLAVPAATVAAPIGDLDALLEEVRADRRQEQQLNREREQRFINEQAERERMLQEAKARLQAAEARSDALKGRFEANEKALGELEATLKERSGVLGELFGVVRQSAGELRAGLGESLVSAQFPERTGRLAALADGARQPTIDQLEGLWLDLLEAMNESGKVVSFQAPVLGADGAATPRTVSRVGPFTAVTDGRFLRYLSDQKRLAELARQPAGRHRDLARGFESAQDGPVAMAVDPSGGAYLGLLVQTPDAVERVRQGGVIGYIILGLGVAGLLVVLERLAYLGFVGRRVRRQQTDLTAPSTKNPLGRVLAVADELQGSDPETLEGKLDEAILRELPPLERGPGLIKLLAAVAPLLGLLGTVTGMIATFQSISLFGTGDPRLMADGISQALVTTMLGLTVAIPLLFLQTLVASRSKSLVQVLDEQGAALLAERLEREAA